MFLIVSVMLSTRTPSQSATSHLVSRIIIVNITVLRSNYMHCKSVFCDRDVCLVFYCTRMSEKMFNLARTAQSVGDDRNHRQNHSKQPWMPTQIQPDPRGSL